MYHAPGAVVAQPSRHARLFELIRQQNLAAMKPTADAKPMAEVTPIVPRPVVQAAPKPAPEAPKAPKEDDFISDRLLKSATASLRRWA